MMIRALSALTFLSVILLAGCASKKRVEELAGEVKRNQAEIIQLKAGQQVILEGVNKIVLESKKLGELEGKTDSENKKQFEFYNQKLNELEKKLLVDQKGYPAKGEISSSEKYFSEAGDAKANYDLGRRYYVGEDVAKDYKEAVKWYTKSADRGYAQAQFELGFCYAEGLGVTKDEKEAVKWYIKAAEQGVAQAQENLAISYNNGQGVTKNEKEAVKWWTKAAAQGNEYAKERLEDIDAQNKAAGLQKAYVLSGTKNLNFAQWDLYMFQKMLPTGTSQEKVVEVMGSPDQQSTSGGWIYFNKVIDKVTSKSLYLRIKFSAAGVKSVESN